MEELNLHNLSFDNLDDLDDFSDSRRSPSMVASNTFPIHIPSSSGSNASAPVEAAGEKREPKGARQIYLITYASVDVVKVPDREYFANIVSTLFSRNDQENIVKQWVCGAEMHPTTRGFHYHLALKLDKARRWKTVRALLKSEYQIDVDFTEWHDSYHKAHEYVSKQDMHYRTSPGHPPIDNAPPTANAIATKRRLAFERAEAAAAGENPAKKAKRETLHAKDMFGILIPNKIRNQKQLARLAKVQQRQGNNDLVDWIASHPSQKYRQDVIDSAWLVEDAEEIAEREEKPLLELLQEALRQDCRTDVESGVVCDGAWLAAALEIIEKNPGAIQENACASYNGKVFSAKTFSQMILNALRYGRSKGHNVMLIGPSDTGKSFLLAPLLLIYMCFVCPAKTSFNFVGALETEVVVFNDIRYDPNGGGDRDFMPWGQLLNLLDGSPINVSMPKTHFTSDVQWTKRQPIFASSDKKIMRIMNGKFDQGESNQMDNRWVYVALSHVWQGGDLKHDLIACPRCFAQLVLTDY
ncbi:MAG: hypothetical protein V3R25_04995 [Nitrosomonadaceae bacterium]